MTKAQAITNFWNSFGWKAYDEATLPDKGVPDNHIVFNVEQDALDSDLALHAIVWDRNTSWVSVTQKADQIAQAIYDMEAPVAVDGGFMWIKRGVPFSQRIEDASDDLERGMLINITVEFLTAY